MAALVYRASVKGGEGDLFLAALRGRLQELKQRHPQLRRCSLVNIGLRRNRSHVDITFYFQKDF